VNRSKLLFYKAAVAILAVASTGCSGLKDSKASAIYNSKHPDKVLFDAATKAIERDRFDVARMTLLTLINTYPHSEYAKNAKTALDDPRMNPCDMAWMVPFPTFAPCTQSDPTLHVEY
jgi:outer membrane protein assembly factor BamD (BamD/ComL family)